MDVGSSFSIYGHLFGWYANNQIVGFLILSGIWLVPYFFILYLAIFGGRGNGEGHRYNPVNSLITLEIQIYLSLLMIALFLNPMVPVSKANFAYDNGTSLETGAGGGSGFSALSATLPDTVKIPPAWYGMIVFTHGFNRTLKQILPTAVTVRQLMHQVQQISVKDPVLLDEYQSFKAHCMVPAQARYAYTMSISGSQLATQVAGETQHVQSQIDAAGEDLSEEWKIATGYAGNQFYTNYFYQNTICPSTDPNGSGSLCIPRGAPPLTPHLAGERFSDLGCFDWWDNGGLTGFGLKTRLQSDFNGSGVQAGLSTLFFDTDKALYGQLTRTNLAASGGDAGIGNREGSVFQWAIEKGSALMGGMGNAVNQFATTIVRFALPILQGVVVMFIVIILPFLILFGRYQPSSIVSTMVTIFGLFLLPGIWHIVTWLDQVVLQAVWSDQNYFVGQVSMGRVAWDLVILSSYAVFTYLWILLVVSMGGRAASSMGSAMSGMSSASNSAMSGGVGLANSYARGVKTKASVGKQ